MGLREDERKRKSVVRYLEHIRDIQREAQGKQDRLAHLRSIAEGMRSATGESVSGGRIIDLADVQAQIDELSGEYAADIKRYGDEIARGYEICPPTSVPRYVCWLHWAEHLSWAKVAEKVRYGESHCKQNLCSRGIDEIYELMPHIWRDRGGVP